MLTIQVLRQFKRKKRGQIWLSRPACILTIITEKAYAKAMFPIAWKVVQSFSLLVTSTPTVTPVRLVLARFPPSSSKRPPIIFKFICLKTREKSGTNKHVIYTWHYIYIFIRFTCDNISSSEVGLV